MVSFDVEENKMSQNVILKCDHYIKIVYRAVGDYLSFISELYKVTTVYI